MTQPLSCRLKVCCQCHHLRVSIGLGNLLYTISDDWSSGATWCLGNRGFAGGLQRCELRATSGQAQQGGPGLCFSKAKPVHHTSHKTTVCIQRNTSMNQTKTTVRIQLHHNKNPCFFLLRPGLPKRKGALGKDFPGFLPLRTSSSMPESLLPDLLD